MEGNGLLMLVKLTYFLESGKYYSEAEYEIESLPLHIIWQNVIEKMNGKRLPGLREGHSDFIVLVDVPEHQHRHPILLGI